MNDRRPTAGELWWLWEALHTAAVFSAADRLGILAALEAGPACADEVARDCDGDPRSTAILLEALAGIGVLEHDDEARFRAAVAELPTLTVLAANADLLVQAVCTGHAPLECEAPAGAARLYSHAVTHLAAFLAPAAEAVAALLQGASRILDVGVGAAPWSIAIARRDPACRVTALDLPAVLPVTRRSVGAMGCADQFDYISGDVFEVPLRRNAYDLVLLGNLCHLIAGDENRTLFRRLRPTIESGGRIAVIDITPSQQPATRRSVTLYAASLMTRTSAGGVHSADSYQAWLEAAGFRDIRFAEASRTPPTTVIIANA
jgi:ubiquinone/menaquinone biosynthesis C-methylase UbiE